MFDKREYNKQYYQKNKEKLNGYSKSYYFMNKEKRIEYTKKYRMENRKKRLERIRKRRIIDLKFNLNSRISASVWKSLKGNKNGYHWEGLVGYTLDNLIEWLKSTMPENCTWQDFLQGKLHVDHIIPISVFNYTKPEHIDFKRCWALENLRLLPAKENIAKSNCLSKPFQPALQI